MFQMYVRTPNNNVVILTINAGKNVDNFGENLMGTDEANALNDISTCENGRIYSTVRIKVAK